MNDIIDEIGLLIKDEISKKEIINKAKELIKEDKDIKGDIRNLINKMLTDNFINKYRFDFVSCIIEYIKEKIFDINIEKEEENKNDKEILEGFSSNSCSEDDYSENDSEID